MASTTSTKRLGDDGKLCGSEEGLDIGEGTRTVSATQFIATWPTVEVASSATRCSAVAVAATDVFKTVYASGLDGLGEAVRQHGWASKHIERSSGFNSGGGTERDDEQRDRVGGLTEGGGRFGGGERSSGFNSGGGTEGRKRVGGLKEGGGRFSGGDELRDEGRRCGGLTWADMGEDERPVVRLWLTSRTSSTAQFITV